MISNSSSEAKGGLNNRLFKIRSLPAVWIGKLLIILTRFLGRGGTTLPGRAARFVDPQLSSHLVEYLREGVITVTGTNGKTTTASLIGTILEKHGLHCNRNRSGSNMIWGVASTLIENATWFASLNGDCAVMEVDEGAFPGVVEEIKPRGAVVTNIFRDQLDRYGELDHIQESISRGLQAQPENGFEVINADDPTLVALETTEGKRRWTYGLEIDPPADYSLNTGRDLKMCPRCASNLNYSRLYYAHLGHYYCPTCDFKRPQPDVTLTKQIINSDGSSSLSITFTNQSTEFSFILPGIYNLYNVLAAFTTALAAGIPPSISGEALEMATPSFGRMEQFTLNGKKIIVALIKNPVGANQVLRTLLSGKENLGLLVAINDKIADGTDVSWLWDVDFEQIADARDRLAYVTVSGLRAWDMAVRLKYAGLDSSRIPVEEDTARALSTALQNIPPGSTLLILPSYTAMLEIRRHLNKMGLGKPYWED
ncbi:MAG: Mur ligase family protein [Bacillota bacterium]|nr:Mur ligase family protein [Bacillota bacterium]